MIRAKLNTITNATGTFMQHNSTGRPGEGISGVIMQHYGFRSIPPAGTDLVNLQDDNNNYSVAENYKNANYGGMESGDVLLYTAGQSVRVKLDSANGEIEITATTKTNGRQLSIVMIDQGITVATPYCSVTLDETNRQVNIQHGNFTVDDQSAIPGTLAPVATKALVDALEIFMTACVAATDPHVAEIKTAATTFMGNVLTTYTTQTLKAK